MIRFAGHFDFELDPADAFERLADMADLDAWNPSVATSRRVSGGRLEPRSRYESTLARGPLRMSARSTLIEVDAGRRVRYEGSIGVLWSVDELRFDPVGDGCRVSFLNESTAPMWLWPVVPIMSLAFPRQARMAMVGALRHLRHLDV